MNHISVLALATAMLVVLLSGCTQQAQGQEKISESHITIAPPPVKKEIKLEPYMFQDFQATFNYPSTMSWRKNTANYMKGKGYAAAYFSDAHSGIIFAYFYVENATFSNEDDYYGVAYGDLSGASEAEQDPLGILHYATSMGKIGMTKLDSGYAAGRRFEASKEGKKIYGVAMDIYAPEATVLYSVRVYSDDADMSDAIAEEFITSLKFGTPSGPFETVLPAQSGSGSVVNVGGNISINLTK